MKILKNSMSILLCAALLLSLFPASVGNASEEIRSMTKNTVEVTVKAVDKETGTDVVVEDALVTLTKGNAILASASTDASGVARFSLEGLAEDDLRNATVQACKTITREKGISTSDRDDLFQHFSEDGSDYYRYEYQLHSETIDADGNWLGKELPLSTGNRADIVFVIDGTGSMEDNLEPLKEELKYFLQYLNNENLDLRFSVIEFRDYNYGELPVLREKDGSHWFQDTDTVMEIINGIEADGGGDTPFESLLDTIHWPLVSDEMDYRNDSFRFAFLITDADTSADVSDGSFYLEPEKDLAEQNIITSVIAEEQLKEEILYRNLCEKTGGAFMGITWPGIYWNMYDVVMSHMQAEAIEMELMLSEPRMIYNLSLCYLADDEASRSEEYLDAIINMLRPYSLNIARTTDGHVYLGKVMIFSTDSLMDFFDTTNIASMADIRMESTKDDSYSIHSNANPNGFYNGQALKISKTFFHDLDTIDDLADLREFTRIQIGGKSYASDGKSFFDYPELIAATLAHESGHYIFGFRDEYYDQTKTDWRETEEPVKPYSEYGLMDFAKDDIEMSKEFLDYRYGTGDTTTYHHQIYGESCEDVLAELLEKGSTDLDSSQTFLKLDKLFESPYKATYTKAIEAGADRRADYPDAVLGDDSFIFLDDQTDGAENNPGEEGFPDGPDFFDESSEDNFALYMRKPGDADLTRIDLAANEDGVITAELPVEEGEMAEVLIATRTGGDVNYETYFVNCTEPTSGYLYSSPDNKVIAYATSEEEASYTFIAQNTTYENGDYASLNQALMLYTDGPQITGGEVYSVAGCTEDVDYTSISWFKYDGNTWTALPTDWEMEENYNIGARADLDGAGLYVLMGKKAANGDAETPSFLIYEPSETRDAVVTMSFDDFNENSKYYYVYYTDVTDEEAGEDEGSDEYAYLENAYMRVYPQEICEHLSDTERAFTLDLPERGHLYQVSVISVLEDGSRSAVSSSLVRAGEADRDGDGIPDWFMNQFHLWPKDAVDISGHDLDGDGLTNLEEYLGGTDPTVPDAAPAVSSPE